MWWVSCTCGDFQGYFDKNEAKAYAEKHEKNTKGDA